MEIRTLTQEATVTINDPSIISSDFVGRGGRYLPPGMRWFTLGISDRELASCLESLGWKIRTGPNGLDELIVWIQEGRFPDVNSWIFQGHTLHLRGMSWWVDEKTGVKAYLDSYELPV